jgi:hypothetical protein
MLLYLYMNLVLARVHAQDHRASTLRNPSLLGRQRWLQRLRRCHLRRKLVCVVVHRAAAWGGRLTDGWRCGGRCLLPYCFLLVAAYSFVLQDKSIWSPMSYVAVLIWLCFWWPYLWYGRPSLRLVAPGRLDDVSSDTKPPFFSWRHRHIDNDIIASISLVMARAEFIMVVVSKRYRNFSMAHVGWETSKSWRKHGLVTKTRHATFPFARCSHSVCRSLACTGARSMHVTVRSMDTNLKFSHNSILVGFSLAMILIISPHFLFRQRAHGDSNDGAQSIDHRACFFLSTSRLYMGALKLTYYWSMQWCRIMSRVHGTCENCGAAVGDPVAPRLENEHASWRLAPLGPISVIPWLSSREKSHSRY